MLPIYDHINYLDNGGVLTAAMAELPEVVDDLTFVYNIKPNVHWQDKPPLNGRQFVAEDAAFGLARFGQDHPEFIWRDRFSSVDQFEVHRRAHPAPHARKSRSRRCSPPSARPRW